MPILLPEQGMCQFGIGRLKGLPLGLIVQEESFYSIYSLNPFKVTPWFAQINCIAFQTVWTAAKIGLNFILMCYKNRSININPPNYS